MCGGVPCTRGGEPRRRSAYCVLSSLSVFCLAGSGASHVLAVIAITLEWNLVS